MRKTLYIAIFLVALATLALEITLTRIFSVTMWYHYAFMAISVAMLGMSTGAVKVYVSDYIKLSVDDIYNKVGMYSIYFSFSTIFSLFTLLAMPFIPRNTGIGIYSMAFVYLVSAVPFYFSGVVISLILATKFIKNVDKLYAADLVGAGPARRAAGPGRGRLARGALDRCGSVARCGSEGGGQGLRNHASRWRAGRAPLDGDSRGGVEARRTLLPPSGRAAQHRTAA